MISIKKAIIIIFCLVLGIVIGLVLAGFIFLPDENISLPLPVIAQGGPSEATHMPKDKDDSAEIESTANQRVISLAFEVAKLIKDRDYEALASYVHPDSGVYFAPYSTLDLNSQKLFSAEELRKVKSDNSQYVWGLYDGIGSPIELSFDEYMDEFVYDEDYLNAPMIGVNATLKTGNSLENTADVFPDGIFVEFHFPGFNPSFDGMDWSSLRLVFVPCEREGYCLSAIIHCQWTI